VNAATRAATMGNTMMKMTACLLAATALAWSARADEWLERVTIALEPPENGQQFVNVRLKPAKNMACDQVVFECVYRQQFTWQNPDGRRATKTLEPVAFTYRRPAVALVADLDCNISFRAPISQARLTEAFGDATFATNAPIRIQRLRIRAEKEGRVVWRQELAAPGDHAIPAATTAATNRPAARTPPAAAKFGAVDLD
jgi:hypothetical protein